MFYLDHDDPHNHVSVVEHDNHEKNPMILHFKLIGFSPGAFLSSGS